MKRKLELVVLVAIAGSAWSLLAAAPADAAPNVEIRIQTTAGSREISVKNRGVGVCKNKSKCPDQVTWEWKKGDELTGEKIVIAFSGGTPDAEKCFDSSYEIAQPKQQTTGTLSADCPPGKVAWFYEIRCEKADGSSCGIPPVDPGVIIDG
jgi:hypothetical protein